MSSVYWQGEALTRQEGLAKLQNFSSTYKVYEQASWDPYFWLQLFEKFSSDMKKEDSPSFKKYLEESHFFEEKLILEFDEALTEVLAFLSSDNLKKKISRELGGERLRDFSRRDMKAPIFEGWLPLGVIFHITPSNALALPFLAFIESLLCGNLNILKTNDVGFSFFRLMFNSLKAAHPAVQALEPFCILISVSATDAELLDGIYPHCDGVSAWGSESSLEQIFSKLRPHCRWIPWGHKISFQFIAKELSREFALVSKIADDLCLFDQQACSSPQILYVEEADTALLLEWGQKLSEELGHRKEIKVLPADAELAEIQKTKALLKAHSAFEKSLGREPAYFIENSRGRIWVDPDSTPKASPLFRTLWVKPIALRYFNSLLGPMRRYLQTVGLAATTARIVELSRALVRVGADRLRPLGGMHDSYAGEAHDGVYAMARFMRRCSFEGDSTFENVYSLNEIAPQELGGASFVKETKILKKDEWSSDIFQEEDKDLFFKSGGSSGKSKLSLFSYEDYHFLMKQAAKGLMAAGLDPKRDRSMNLFYGGALYGGFLSFFTILEFLEAKQFPMIAYPDYGYVADTILEHKVNVLLGMPSYLFALFEKEGEKLKKAKIEKIYYGGEAMSRAQKEWLQKEFSIKVIRSATYGSVDLGPLGYQCLHTEGGVHHLHSSVLDLQILKLDSDEKVAKNETGRLVFSSKVRASLSRPYEIGDLGRWVEGACDCGRTDALFELQGRIGDIFRASGAFFNYQKIEQILRDELNYCGDLQVLLSKDSTTGSLWRDVIEVRLDKDKVLAQDKVHELLLEFYPDLREIVLEKTLGFRVSFCPHSQFVMTAQSGKLKHLVDQRLEL